MIDIVHIESGNPVTSPPATHVAAQVVDHAAFRESFAANAGIVPGLAAATTVKPVTIVAQSKDEATLAAATPKLVMAVPAKVEPEDPVVTVPKPVAAGKPGEPTESPKVSAAQVPAEPQAVKAVEPVPVKKAVRKPDPDVAAAAPVAAEVSPVVIAAPVPVAVPVAPIQPVSTAASELPVQAPASVKGAKPAILAAKVPAGDPKKAEAKPAVAVAGSTSPVLVSTPTVQPQSVTPAAPPAASVGAIHAAPSVSGISSKFSETSIVAAKVAEARAPISTGTDLQTLVATANVLEVGVASGTHGWLRVRAEMGQMGQVTASVVAASAGAAEGLHKELPAISAYLAGERVGVSSLVVNSASASAEAQDAALSAGPQTGGGSGASQRGQSAQPGTPDAVAGDDDLPMLDFGLSAMNLPLAIQANGSGGWLSVRV